MTLRFKKTGTLVRLSPKLLHLVKELTPNDIEWWDGLTIQGVRDACIRLMRWERPDLFPTKAAALRGLKEEHVKQWFNTRISFTHFCRMTAWEWYLTDRIILPDYPKNHKAPHADEASQ